MKPYTATSFPLCRPYADDVGILYSGGWIGVGDEPARSNYTPSCHGLRSSFLRNGNPRHVDDDDGYDFHFPSASEESPFVTDIDRNLWLHES